MTADPLAALGQRLRRAILTLHCARDRDRAFLHRDRVSWPEMVQNAADAYGYTPSRRRRFIPSPADIDDMLPALSLLATLRCDGDEGERAVRIITARAFDVPWWRIADRLGRSDRQVQRWFRAALADLLRIEQQSGTVMKFASV